MRILQLSDFHLRGDGKLSFRVVDTPRCLEVAAEHLRRLVQKPDMIVITGDLADSGDEHAYHMLYDAISPLGIPTYAVPGNHDRRDRMRSILRGWCPENEETAPYLCYTVEKDDVRFIMMDSMTPALIPAISRMSAPAGWKRNLRAVPAFPRCCSCTILLSSPVWGPWMNRMKTWSG